MSDIILQKLDKISAQVADVKTDTAVHANEIHNINEKLGRGQKAFDDIRSHLRTINGSMQTKSACLNLCNEIDSSVKKDRKLLYFLAAALLLGGGTALNFDKILKVFRIIP